METVFDRHRPAPTPETNPRQRERETGATTREEAIAEALVVAAIGLAAALAFAIVGFTTIAMAALMPGHWVVGILFSGLFALLVTAAGLVAAVRFVGRRTGP